MKCSKCKQNVPDGSVFCLHCGARMDSGMGSASGQMSGWNAASQQGGGGFAGSQSGFDGCFAADMGSSGQHKKSVRRKTAKKNRGGKKVLMAAGAVVLVLAVVVGIVAGGRAMRYRKAVGEKENGNYLAAMTVFEEMEDYQEAQSEALECGYLYACEQMRAGDLDTAKEYFRKVGNYQDAQNQILECDYQLAVELLEQGDYPEAENRFESLVDYKDSKTMVYECRYRQAKEAFDDGDYEKAKSLYLRTDGYQDAETCINECLYQLGQQELMEGDYLGAYEHFQYVPGNHKDTEAMVIRCLYNIIRDYYEDGAYEKAFDYVESLSYHDVPESEYDTSFLTDLQLRYAEKLIDSKNEDSIDQAMEMLEGMKSTQQVKNLIKKGETQRKQNIYDAGMKHLNNKQYSSAISKFEQIQDFSDAKKQWLAAMYGYVQINRYKFDGDNSALYKTHSLLGDAETFYEYAKILSDNNYQDSRAYYKELTAWHMEITMNDSQNSTTDAFSVSKFDLIYAHLKLSGGPLNGETKIRYVFTLPSGSSPSGYFDWEWEEGDSGSCYCYYNDPYRGSTGTCYVKIYDGSGNLIGKDQIRVTYY